MERNVRASLDAVDLLKMQRCVYFIQLRTVVPTNSNSDLQTIWYMHAYRLGINGAQAIWANKKYHGHRVLPVGLMKELEVSNA